ncbi:MAG: hypothetical protein ACRC4Y_03625, partial [Cetobacterium sp.]
MLTRIYAFFLLLATLVFSDTYIPKSLEEEAYLKHLRTKEIRVGLRKSEFYNISTEEEKSLNEIVKDLFQNYLNLNVKFEEDYYYNLKTDLIEKRVDIITLINREDYASRFLNFTNTIFSETIFVASTSTQLYTLEELEGRDIYVSKGHVYKNYVKAILTNNGINARLIEVDDLNDYKDKLILTPTPVLYDSIYGVKISNSGGIAIGLAEEYSELIPILDRVLNDTYRDKFLKSLYSISKKLALQNFYKSLTPKELQYLQTLTKLRIVYESEYSTLMSYLSKLDGRYKGVFPKTVNQIGDLLNIKIIDETHGHLKSLTDLKAKKIDMIALSHTRERSRDFIFSKKI